MQVILGEGLRWEKVEQVATNQLVLQKNIPGDLPDPGIQPGSPASQADSLSSEPPAGCWWDHRNA